MLKPTDIHYLVGLLTVVSDKDAVEIELGTMVWDQAAEKTRDIDVTVTYKLPDGTIGAFKGIEVKDHSRPLTVEQVEQLVIKFQDIPQITHKAIVSASGFTPAAVKKAHHHKVDLIEFATWTDRNGVFGLTFHEKFHVFHRDFHWQGNPVVSLRCKPTITIEELNINLHNKIYDHDGNELFPTRDVKGLGEFFAQTALNQMISKVGENPVNLPKEFPVRIEVEAQDRPIIKIFDQDIMVEGATVSGIITWIETETSPIFKMLVRHGETKPYIGVVISELPNGELLAVTLTNSEHNVSGILVSVDNRLKRKIYRHKLK